jgi:hypothetical protein
MQLTDEESAIVSRLPRTALCFAGVSAHTDTLTPGAAGDFGTLGFGDSALDISGPTLTTSSGPENVNVSIIPDPATVNRDYLAAAPASTRAAGPTPLQTFSLTGNPLTTNSNSRLRYAQWDIE